MTQTFRSLVTTAALVAALAPAALAGGANARVEGPAKDGRTYTVRTYMCSNPASLKMNAWAEGTLNGKRTSVPLTITKTRQKGVFQFVRTWPADGKWAVRLELGEGKLPVTVAALDGKGAVMQTQLIWEGNGTSECNAFLAGDDDC